MKFLRKSPVVIAATAVIAAPSAIADPVVLTPPAQNETQTAPPQLPAPPPAATVVTPSASPSPQQPDAPALRGPTGPLPTDLSPIAAPPPPPPPAAPPSPPPPPAVTTPVVAAPPPPPPPRIVPAPTASVTVGVQEGYTRLAFTFEGATTVTPTLTGNRLELRFSRGADIDIAEIRSHLPRFVREVRRVSAAGAPVRLAFTLDPGVRQRNFVDGNRVVVDLLAPDPSTTSTAADGVTTAPVPGRPPVTGVGRVQLVEGANDTSITVTWNAPARAAAFRRGEAIWILFDASNGRMDLSGVARAGRRHQDIEIVRGDGVTGLRIPASADIQVSAAATDNAWTFTLGARATPSEHAALTRQVSAEGAGRLTVNFGREGAVRWVTDPEIGDRIAVALIGGPAKGVDARRATVEAAVLPTAHGAVIEPRADGVTAVFDHGNLIVSNGEQGLIAAAAPQASAASEASAALEQALNESGEEPQAQARAQQGLSLAQVRARIESLTRRAAAEGTMEGAPVTARMELARFLLQNELAPEALGALRLAAVNQGELVELDPEYRLMRGAANVMMGRNDAALADLNASALNDNLSAALWRGYAAAQKADWQTARRELERGAGAMEGHPPGWRARFQLALAQAAFELGDHAAAEAAARAALGQAPSEAIRLQSRLIEARLMVARNDPTHALALFDELARARDEEVAVRASLEAIRLRRSTGVMRAVDVIEPLEALRFRWRGDALELAIVATLGDVYSELGRWRDALGVMRTTAERYPMNPEARRLRADMQTLFERLFLDGEADQLEPIQALGLFYEFSDLTPVGPNGDRIVRLLAGRLVQVDLLEQAAQLLQHQVDERLEGLSKTQVAGDLAAIYLMDDKPDRALVALAGSRQPNMPASLLAERRILEARALLGLGRLDNAVELVERDRSADAQAVRAEAAWRARDWDRASAELRTLLGMRNRALPFDVNDRQMVLRAGIAMTLAGDDAGVRQLYRDYAGDMANSPEADAFEVVAAGINAEGASIREVARAVARTDLLDRFMTRVRTRMTAEAPPPAQAPGTPPAPPPQAQATPPAAPPRQEAGT